MKYPYRLLVMEVRLRAAAQPTGLPDYSLRAHELFRRLRTASRIALACTRAATEDCGRICSLPSLQTAAATSAYLIDNFACGSSRGFRVGHVFRQQLRAGENDVLSLVSRGIRTWDIRSHQPLARAEQIDAVVEFARPQISHAPRFMRTGCHGLIAIISGSD
jgi:hypothetical protein